MAGTPPTSGSGCVRSGGSGLAGQVVQIVITAVVLLTVPSPMRGLSRGCLSALGAVVLDRGGATFAQDGTRHAPGGSRWPRRTTCAPACSTAAAYRSWSLASPWWSWRAHRHVHHRGAGRRDDRDDAATDPGRAGGARGDGDPDQPGRLGSARGRGRRGVRGRRVGRGERASRGHRLRGDGAGRGAARSRRSCCSARASAPAETAAASPARTEIVATPARAGRSWLTGPTPC